MLARVLLRLPARLHRELTAAAADVSGLRWTEVDTFEDLEQARRLFAPESA